MLSENTVKHPLNILIMIVLASLPRGRSLCYTCIISVHLFFLWLKLDHNLLIIKADALNMFYYYYYFLV